LGISRPKRVSQEIVCEQAFADFWELNLPSAAGIARARRSTFHSAALSPLMEFFSQQLVRMAAGEAPPFERFLIRGMLFLNATLRSNTFRGTAPVHFRLSEESAQQVGLLILRLDFGRGPHGACSSACNAFSKALPPLRGHILATRLPRQSSLNKLRRRLDDVSTTGDQCSVNAFDVSCESWFRASLGACAQATTVKNMAEEVQKSLASFWDDARLNAVVTALIQHYFPLTVSDATHRTTALPESLQRSCSTVRSTGLSFLQQTCSVGHYGSAGWRLRLSNSAQAVVCKP